MVGLVLLVGLGKILNCYFSKGISYVKTSYLSVFRAHLDLGVSNGEIQEAQVRG